MKITIDDKSGFCFGVINAVTKAEEALTNGGSIYCLGDIVHNQQEVQRLEKLGLRTITRDEYFNLKNCTVLLRAHGEPPATYEHARRANIRLIDGTCPVVLKLQDRVRKGFEELQPKNGQLVLLGKKGHAEIEGLNGQTGEQAIIVETEADLLKIDPDRPVLVFSQTTKSLDEFRRLSGKISSTARAGAEIKDSICRQVANRVPRMREFAAQHDIVVFVGGQKSSNGKALFDVCRSVNPNSHFVSGTDDLRPEWFANCQSVGITGATSTPKWQMQEIADKLLRL